MTLLCDEGLERQKDQNATIVSAVLRDHGEELKGAFAVVTASRLRIRRPES